MRSRRNPGRSYGWAFSRGHRVGHETGLDLLKAGVDTVEEYRIKVAALFQVQREDPLHVIYEFGDYPNCDTLLKAFERGENEGAALALNEWKEYLSTQVQAAPPPPPRPMSVVRPVARPVRSAAPAGRKLTEAEARVILAKIEADARVHLAENRRVKIKRGLL